jgi:hypothetical protein
MSVDRQAQALLDLVAADRAQKCEAILAEARGKAADLLRQAHTDARDRMRKAFREERERHDARVNAARANLQTRRRLGLQQRAAALLATASTRLPDELLRRWEAAPTRRTWVAAVIADARRLMPGGAWQILHARNWPATEREAIATELASALGAAPTFIADAGIRAGLKICADGNIVDGTLDGLIADRAVIGAQVLHLLEAEAEA